MKREILKKLNAIKKLHASTGVEGKLLIKVTGSVKEFDEAIASITEFERYNYCFSISDKLSVTVNID